MVIVEGRLEKLVQKIPMRQLPVVEPTQLAVDLYSAQVVRYRSFICYEPPLRTERSRTKTHCIAIRIARGGYCDPAAFVNIDKFYDVTIHRVA